MRKKAFGSLSVYGEEGNYEIKGCWLGLEPDFLGFLKKNVESAEYYNYTELDLNKPADLQMVKDYWTKNKEETDVVEGLKLQTFKYFK
jgi:hypothetical protein